MSDNARTDLLKRIRKCLALAKSSNEHEAAAALAKARELMDAHDLTQDDVDLAEIGEASVRGNCAQKPPMWESMLCNVVQRALGVQAIIGYQLERIYVGRGAAPEIAAYAFAVLFRQLKAARAAYIQKNLKRCTLARKRQRADIFCEAWATAVLIKVAKLMPAQTQDERASRYIATKFGPLDTATSREASTKGVRSDEDYWNGRAAGSKVELANAVSNASQPQGLLNG